MKTDQAKAAAEIRKHLKSKGLKCSVTSDSGSMTSSVRVKLYDQPPEVVKEITDFANQYQYGHFDGMTDMYEYSNSQDAIPQAKYVFVDNSISDELNQKAWDFMRPRYEGADKLPKLYKDIGSTDRIFDEWAVSAIHRFINGHWMEKDSQKFWKSLEPAPTTPAPTGGMTIEEHTHTKKGFQMFICILPAQVEREEYLKLLEIARSLGGWYSRKWGNTPAGFAFKNKDKAVEFSGGTIPTTTTTGKYRNLFLGEKKADTQRKIDSGEYTLVNLN